MSQIKIRYWVRKWIVFIIKLVLALIRLCIHNCISKHRNTHPANSKVTGWVCLFSGSNYYGLCRGCSSCSIPLMANQCMYWKQVLDAINCFTGQRWQPLKGTESFNWNSSVYLQEARFLAWKLSFFHLMGNLIVDNIKWKYYFSQLLLLPFCHINWDCPNIFCWIHLTESLNYIKVV